MSWNCTAYFSDAWALLLTEHVIVLCVYAAHACSFNYKSDYTQWLELRVFTLLNKTTLYDFNYPTTPLSPWSPVAATSLRGVVPSLLVTSSPSSMSEGGSSSCLYGNNTHHGIDNVYITTA